MQNVSRVTGGNINIKIKGRDVILKEMSIDNLGSVQEEILKQKKRRHIESAVLAKELLPPEEGKEVLKEAMREASEFFNVTEKEVSTFLNTQEGVCFFIWVIIESQYPGMVTKSEVGEMIVNNDLNVDHITTLTDRLFGNNGGNETGQGSEASAAQ